MWTQRQSLQLFYSTSKQEKKNDTKQQLAWKENEITVTESACREKKQQQQTLQCFLICKTQLYNIASCTQT